MEKHFASVEAWMVLWVATFLILPQDIWMIYGQNMCCVCRHAAKTSVG